jgi:hypothetical protein
MSVTNKTYTDQKTIINAYADAHEDMDETAMYLFFVAEVVDKEANIAGYMPLTYNAGFIYGLPVGFVKGPGNNDIRGFSG